MNQAILPFAITMMAGPQIMAAIIFVTTPKPLRTAGAFVLGVVVATPVGVLIALGIASLLGNGVSLGDSSDKASTGSIIRYLLVAALAALAVKNYLGRETVEPPRWLGTLMGADPRQALKTGLLVILLMPSDVIIMLTVGVNLAQNDLGLVAALPFIAATVLMAALPLLLSEGQATCASWGSRGAATRGLSATRSGPRARTGGAKSTMRT